MNETSSDIVPGPLHICPGCLNELAAGQADGEPKLCGACMLRGVVLAYAECLRLDGRDPGAGDPEPRGPRLQASRPRGAGPGPHLKLVAAVLAVVAIALAIELVRGLR